MNYSILYDCMSKPTVSIFMFILLGKPPSTMPNLQTMVIENYVDYSNINMLVALLNFCYFFIIASAFLALGINSIQFLLSMLGINIDFTQFLPAELINDNYLLLRFGLPGIFVVNSLKAMQK